MRTLKNLLLVLKFLSKLHIIQHQSGVCVVRHPCGLRMDYRPAGTDGNLLDELYLQFTGALLQSSVVLSIQHQGERPWQQELCFENADEATATEKGTVCKILF